MSAGRENVIQTYLGLGRTVEHSRVTRYSSHTMCLAPAPLSFCNFAIDFSMGADAREEVEQLADLARSRKTLRVFHMPGDKPENLGRLLSAAGFSVISRLAQMGAICDERPCGIELDRCEDAESRQWVAEFIATQFFWRNEGSLRARIVRATIDSDNELYFERSSGAVVAAVMLSRSHNALGLYNLCVDTKLRGRGIGAAIVQWCANHAASAGVPLVLQCDEALESWYGAQSLSKFAFLEAWGLR